jgi:hypothetical protein
MNNLSRFVDGKINHNFMFNFKVKHPELEKEGTVIGYYEDNADKPREEGKDRLRFKVKLSDGKETDWLEKNCVILLENLKSVV